MSEEREPFPALAQAAEEEAKRRALIHFHRWEIMGIWRPDVTRPSGRPVHPRMAEVAEAERPITIALLKCRECDWPETVVLDGAWTLAQVKGETQ